MLLSEKKLKEIGAQLHQARLRNKISLDSVAAHTLIAKRVLKAIEEGDLQKLPEPFYVKALIDKYAQAVGVAKIWDQDSEVQEAQATPGKLMLRQSSTPKTENRAFAFQIKSTHLYVLYLALVIIAVRAIASFVEQPVTVDNSVVEEKDVPVEKVIPIDNSAPTTISSASPSQFVSQSSSNSSDVVVVDISLKDRCWLKVMVDGKVEFEGTLPKGTQRSWTGREQINIIAGNAGGVVVTYNHGQEKLLGKPGQVEEVTYTVN